MMMLLLRPRGAGGFGVIANRRHGKFGSLGSAARLAPSDRRQSVPPINSKSVPSTVFAGATDFLFLSKRRSFAAGFFERCRRRPAACSWTSVNLNKLVL